MGEQQFNAWLTKHSVLEVLVYFVQRDKQCNCWSAIKHQTLGVVYQTRYIAMQSIAPVQRALPASDQGLTLRFGMQQSLKCFCEMSILCTTLKFIGGRFIATPILNHGIGSKGVVSLKLRPLYSQEKGLWYALNPELGRSQVWFRRCGEERNLSLLPRPERCFIFVRR
jgi:hypothetical protein